MNLNIVVLAGRATRDPVLRHTDGGTAVTELGIAINRQFTTSTGERRQETCFVEVVFWGRRAEVICEHAKKGTGLLIEGRLELDEWESPEGQKRSRLRVVAENFQFAEKKQTTTKP